MPIPDRGGSRLIHHYEGTTNMGRNQSPKGMKKG